MKNSNKNEELKEILNEKYDDMFEFVSSGNELWNKDYNEYIFSSENFDGALTTVWTYDDGTIIDSYLAIKYKKSVEEAVKKIADEVYGECIVINKPTKMAKAHFSSEMTANEYMADKRSNITTHIITNAPYDLRDEAIEKIRISLKEQNICTNIKIYYYSISLNEINTNIGENKAYEPLPDFRGILLINEDYSIGSLSWSEYYE